RAEEELLAVAEEGVDQAVGDLGDAERHPSRVVVGHTHAARVRVNSAGRAEPHVWHDLVLEDPHPVMTQGGGARERSSVPRRGYGSIRCPGTRIHAAAQPADLTAVGGT